MLIWDVSSVTVKFKKFKIGTQLRVSFFLVPADSQAAGGRST
jgi:hypothetical protein